MRHPADKADRRQEAYSARNEATDATHLAEFHQVEGVVADYDITLGNLICQSFSPDKVFTDNRSFHADFLLSDG